MTDTVPRSARLDLPPWFWGGTVAGYFQAARLRASKDSDGIVEVQADERLTSDRPHLVRATELHGDSAKIVKPFLNDLETHTLAGLGQSSLIPGGDAEEEVKNQIERIFDTNSPRTLAAGLYAHQLQTMAAPSHQLESVIDQLWQDLRDIRMETSGEPAFDGASVFFISRQAAVLHRLKLAPVLLRLQHDKALWNANPTKTMDASSAGALIFNSSSGLSSGVMTMDAYFAPLLGAMTPFVWAFPASRASGTILYTLGTQIAGTEAIAAEPLHVIPCVGPVSSSRAPNLQRRSASASVNWWVRRLDQLLSVLSDPSVFTDENDTYVPSKHLHAHLTIEQLFRRTGSIQLAHRDASARRVLLFTTLDTLERVSSRSLTAMCTLSEARRTLDALRKSLSSDVAALMLPAAERAVDALTKMQDGFFLAGQLGKRVIEFSDAQGQVARLSLEEATAEYMRVLRNATHGHGSNRAENRPKTDALLAFHDGEVPHDLPLLSYLYLLDLLTHPDQLRRRLWNGGLI